MVNADILDELFDNFGTNATVFKDREVLRHDYLPDRLPHREGQIRQLGEIVAPLLKGARSSNIFIYGNTGTGKTAVVKYVLTRLEFKAKEFNAPRQVLLRQLQAGWIRVQGLCKYVPEFRCSGSVHRIVRW